MTRWMIVAVVGAVVCPAIGYLLASHPSVKDEAALRKPLKEQRPKPVAIKAPLSHRSSTPPVQRTSPAMPFGETTEKPTPNGEEEDAAQEDGDEAESIADMTFDEIKAYESRQQAALYERLNARFSGQHEDRSWRISAEERLSAAFHAIGSDGVEIGRSECRSDICMTALIHDGRRPPPGLIGGFTSQFVPGFEHVFRYDDGRTTIYSIRHGDELAAQD
jgi:hypothetical protein